MSVNQPQRIEISILSAARTIRRAFDSRLASIGLNLTQAALLRFLRDEGPLTQRELADLLHLGRASTGEFIVGLERRGLVARTADPSDRRVWIVSLTPDGLPLVEQFESLDEDLRREFRAGLTRAELKATAEVLGVLGRNAEAAAQGELDGHARPRAAGRRRDQPDA